MEILYKGHDLTLPRCPSIHLSPHCKQSVTTSVWELHKFHGDQSLRSWVNYENHASSAVPHDNVQIKGAHPACLSDSHIKLQFKFI